MFRCSFLEAFQRQCPAVRDLVPNFGASFKGTVRERLKNSLQCVPEALCASVFHVNAVAIAMRFVTSVPRGRGVLPSVPRLVQLIKPPPLLLPFAASWLTQVP